MKSIISIAIVAALVLLAAVSDAQAKELTMAEFRQMREDKERCLLLLAHVHWTPRSRTAKKLVDKLASYFPTSNYTEVDVAMVDIQAYPELKKSEHVSNPPEWIFYSFGGEPIHYGFHTDGASLKEMLNNLADRLDHDKNHRMLAQERAKEEAKWRIPHPSPGQVVDFESEDQFYELTHDITRTVIVMFYAKWCQACREYGPDYARIAENFVKDEKIIVGKLDSERFSKIADKYKIEGFPTLMIFYKNREGKEGMLYEGERDPDHLIGYLNQHHQIPVDYSGGNQRLMDELQRMTDKGGEGQMEWVDDQGEIQRNDPHEMGGF